MLKRLEGAFALAIIFTSEHDLMIGARMGAPLAVGHGEGQMYLGSDAIALAPFTNRVTYLEDGDWVALTRSSIEILDAEGRQTVRPMNFTQASAFMADKGKHRHFMAKEIAEQPEVVGHTLAEYVDFGEQAARLPNELKFDFANLDRLTITACGTAYLCRPHRQILVRALCPAADGGRYRLRIPLPRGAAAEERGGHRHLAIGRDGRHAGGAALLQGARAADSGDRQCAGARRSRAKPMPPFVPMPVLRSASPRPRPSPASSPCLPHSPIAAGKARGAISRDRSANWSVR